MTISAAPVETGDFETFYRERWDGAVRLAHVFTGVNEVAEDLAQEAFVQVRAKWAGITQPAAYLRTTLVNTCRSWHRSRDRRQQRELRTAPVNTPTFSPEIDETLRLLDDLPERQRIVLVMRFYLDADDREIAETLGCREATVRSLASRAIARLREVMSS